MKNLMMKAHVKGMAFKQKSIKILNSNKGEGFVDSAVKILISVVIGALLLTGLYMLFQDTILPTLQQRIQDMFNYNG